MERDVGTLERDQQLVLVGVQSVASNAVEGHKLGARREDPIEAPGQRALEAAAGSRP